MIDRADHLEKMYGATGWVSTLRNALPQTARNVSLVVSEARFKVGQVDEYSGNAFALYGAAAIQNLEEDGLTGMSLSVTDLNWDIDYDDLDELDTAGIVALINRRGRVRVWKDRTLATTSTDPGKYLTNMRIVQTLVNDITKALQKFIGGPFPSSAEVESLVREAIEKREGFLASSYDITFYRRRGFFTVDLSVEFFGFIHTITAKVEIKI